MSNNKLTNINLTSRSPSYFELAFQFGNRFQAVRFDHGNTKMEVCRDLYLLLRNIEHDSNIEETPDNPNYKVKVENDKYMGTMVSTTRNGYQWSTIHGNKEELLEVARKIQEYFK